MKFAFVLCLFLMACQHSGSASHGGQDGGGGETPSSTPEQVRAAITQAYSLVTNADVNQNVFKRFWLSEIGIFWKETYFNPRPLFPKVAKLTFTELQPSDFSSPVLEGLAARPPQLLEHGVCGQSSRKHADASVSAFSADGTVCFSLERLSRFPPDPLLGELLALLLHECIHLGGVRSETEADAWQNRFREYFHWRFGSLAGQRTHDLIQRNFLAGELLLRRAKHLFEKDSSDPMAFATLGAFAMNLVTIPSLLDPLTLELSLKPAHSEYYNNYANAVITTYEQTVKSVASREAPLVAIEHLLQLHIVAYHNYRAYERGEGTSTCILPESYGLPPDVFNYLNVSNAEAHGGASLSSAFAADVSPPPRACSP